jgi:hypothetical protein
MKLWNEWHKHVLMLKSSCNNYNTFYWMMAILIAFSIRSDLAGVTSFVRCLNLKPTAYFCILHFFHSNGVNREYLTQLWIKLCLSLFKSCLYKCGDHYVVIADGLVRPKEGLRMPAVKSLHQSSANNSKATFVMGHFFECLAFLVTPANSQAHAIPITSRIHDGIILEKNDRIMTLMDRFCLLVKQLFFFIPVIIVADAYYYAKKVMISLKARNNYLITRMRTNAVVWEPYNGKNKQRGRKKKYGKKLYLGKLFKQIDKFLTDYSPVYGDSKVKIKYRIIDAVIRPRAFNVRIVLVIHPQRGKIILLSTNTELPALKIIEIYGYRYKIEVSFKSAIHNVGVYVYHFWMQMMEKIKRGSGSQDIRRSDEKYKEKISQKMNSYMLYVQLGLIAQGLLKYLSIKHKDTIWKLYDSWMRTMNKKNCPSENIVMHVLNSCKRIFIIKSYSDKICKKFFRKHFIISRFREKKVANY